MDKCGVHVLISIDQSGSISQGCSLKLRELFMSYLLICCSLACDWINNSDTIEWMKHFFPITCYSLQNTFFTKSFKMTHNSGGVGKKEKNSKKFPRYDIKKSHHIMWLHGINISRRSYEQGVKNLTVGRLNIHLVAHWGRNKLTTTWQSIF